MQTKLEHQIDFDSELYKHFWKKHHLLKNSFKYGGGDGLFHLGTCPDSVGQRFNELLMQLWLNGLLGTLKCPSVFVFVLCF